MIEQYLKKKIAVIGVSHRQGKFGFKIFRDLLDRGFTVESINPTDGEICGKKIYRSLKEIPFIPDLVITVVPSEITERIVEECNELSIREVWMQPGSESEEAVEKARYYGISVIYNRCFMVENGIW